MKPIRGSYTFLAALILLHGLAFITAFKFGGIYMKDSFEYLNQAYNLFHYHSWYAAPWQGATNMDYFSFRPPLYAAFIGAIKFFSESDYAILLVQNVMSISNLLLIHAMAKQFQLLEGKKGMVMILLLLMMPLQLLLANMVMSELLFQTLFLWLFHACQRFGFKPDPGRLWPIAILLSLLLFTKPVSLLLLPVVIFWIWYVARKRTFKFYSPFLIVIVSFIWIGLQHQHETNWFHYTSMKPFNQYKFNARFVLANRYGEEMAEHWADSTKVILNEQSNYTQRYQLMDQFGNDVLKAYPLTFLKLYLKGCAVFLLDPGRHDIAVFFNWDDHDNAGLFYKSNAAGDNGKLLLQRLPVLQLVVMGVLLAVNMLILLACMYFLLKSNAPQWLRLLCFLLFIYVMGATGLLGVARYRSVLFPEIMLACLFTVDSFLRRRNHAV